MDSKVSGRLAILIMRESHLRIFIKNKEIPPAIISNFEKNGHKAGMDYLLIMTNDYTHSSAKTHQHHYYTVKRITICNQPNIYLTMCKTL